MRLGVSPKDPPCMVVVVDHFGHVVDVAQHVTMRQALQRYPAGMVEVYEHGRLVWNGPRHDMEGST